MTLAIILFVMVLLGIALFGYAFHLSKQRNKNRQDAMESGKDVREGKTGKY